MEDFRREGPRIDVDALCWEVADSGETPSLAIDLSEGGIKIERPYVGGPSRETVPLQLDIPGIDEVMWARGNICFDRLVQVKGPAGGKLGLLRRTGYRIALAARRDRRMLREFVNDTYLMNERMVLDFEVDLSSGPTVQI